MACKSTERETHLSQDIGIEIEYREPENILTVIYLCV